MPQKFSAPHWLVLLLPCAMAAPAVAQLPTARLDAVFPPGLRAGSEVEVTLQGVDLDDVKELLFSHPGLTAVHGEGAKFKVTAAANVPPGTHEVRVKGRYGISSSRLIAVGSLTESVDPGTNDTTENAFVITPPVTVNGIVAADAADYFRFNAAKGQRVIISCAAQRIDSPLHATLSVSDAAGIEFARVHHTLDRDPMLDFTAPADGALTIKLHDVVWKGGPASVYRLTITGTPDDSLMIAAIPLTGAVCDWMLSAPFTEETEPNNTPETAQKLTLPAAVNARCDDADWFEFTGKKGRKVMLDILSHRLGQPSDVFVRVQKITRDASGKETSQQVAEFDDTSAPPGTEPFRLGARDPSGSIVCDGDAVYRVFAGDRFNTHSQYRLLLRDPNPGFSLVAVAQSPAASGKSVMRWSPLLRRNGSAMVSVAVLRRDGFDAPVALRVDGLPPGVSAAETTVPPGVAAASLVLRAAPDVKPWTGRIKITGQSGGATFTAREATPRWSVDDTGKERPDMRLSTDGFVLAVTDVQAAPLAITPAESKIYETSLAGSIEVPVKFARDASNKGFKGEWEASLFGLPGLRQPQIVKPGGNAAEAKLVLNLTKKDGNVFTAGTWNFYATARGTIQWQPEAKTPVRELLDAAFSSPMQVKIAPSPVSISVSPEIAAMRGGKTELPVKIERRYGFAGNVDLSLVVAEGVKGLTAAKVQAAAGAAEAKLTIECAADAAPGKYACRIASKCQWNGEELTSGADLTVEVKP